jgi:hypothetical protein
VRQLTAHVVRQVDSYIGSVEAGRRGDLDAVEPRDQRAQILNRIASQQPSAILAEFRETVDRFEAWFGALSAEQLAVLGPHSHGPRSAAWFVEQRLSEVAFHGRDLALSLDQPAEIDPETARFLLPMLLEQNFPAIVARDRTGGEGVYGLVVRGEPEAAWRLEFGPGSLTTTAGAAGAADADAVFEADPAAFGLLIYRRASLEDLEQAGRLTVRGDRSAAARFMDLYGPP